MNHQPPPPPSPGDDAWLEAMIRQDEPDYLPDNGFTARVLGALPSPNRRTEHRRLALVLGAAAIGCVFAGLLAGPSFSADCLELTRKVTTPLVAPTSGTEIAMTVGSLALLVGAAASGCWTLARRR